jgi:hypothetical protein
VVGNNVFNGIVSSFTGYFRFLKNESAGKRE